MTRPFTLTIDSGNEDEPPPKHFASLQAARRSFFTLAPYWQRFAWITEQRERREAVVVHMRDGRETHR